MWRKQAEAKPSPASAEPAGPTPVAPERVAAFAPVPAPTPNLRGGETSRIAQHLTFKGEISGREDIYLDGTVEGAIRLPESRVTVGPNGRIAADIEAGEIVIEGFVQGRLSARTRIELRRSSAVRGDIVTPRLAVQEGARYTGKVEMVRPEDVRASRAVASASTSADDLRAVPLGAQDPVS